jgi:hypothetical protein
MAGCLRSRSPGSAFCSTWRSLYCSRAERINVAPEPSMRCAEPRAGQFLMFRCGTESPVPA